MFARPPPLPADFVPPPRPHFLRGKGWRRYVPDVVERTRVLVVGTNLSEAAIAARIGIGVGTVHAWKVRRGWQRPSGVPVSTRKVGLARAGFTRRCREILAAIERAAGAEIERLVDADDPAALRRAMALADAARGAVPSSRRSLGGALS